MKHGNPVMIDDVRGPRIGIIFSILMAVTACS